MGRMLILIYGELVMGRILVFVTMRGSQIVLIEELSLLKGDISCLRFLILFISLPNWNDDLIRRALWPIDAQ